MEAIGRCGEIKEEGRVVIHSYSSVITPKHVLKE
jgi:hypothetical protein